MKVCSKCNIEKDENEFYIDYRTMKLYGKCKKCHEELTRKWKKDNPEKNKAIYKKSRRKNKTKVNETNRQWRLRNLEKVREINRIRQKLDDPIKKRKRNKKWKLNNPDKVKAMDRRWAKKNPHKRREYVKRWQKKNPELVKKMQLQKSAKLKNGYLIHLLIHGNGFTKEQIKAMPELLDKKKLEVLLHRSNKILKQHKNKNHE